MAHIGRAADMADISDLVDGMVRVGRGRPVAEVAQAALTVALGLWAAGDGVTREMALEVVRSQIDAVFRERSN